MNFKIFVIRPLEAGISPFIFQAPSDLVAIKTLLASATNLQNGHKLYDYDFELVESGSTLSAAGEIVTSLLAKHKVLGKFSDYHSRIAEYGILATQPQGASDGQPQSN